MAADALPVTDQIPNSEIGAGSASLQTVPASLESLLAQHGIDPGADSRTRVRPSLAACLVGDVHVGLGMGLALAAVILIGPTLHMAWNALGFGLASAIAVLALGRPSRAQGRSDLVIATLLCGLLAAVGGVGLVSAPLDPGAAVLIHGGVLLGGLLLACAGLHIDRGFTVRLARVTAPLVPLAAVLAVR